MKNNPAVSPEQGYILKYNNFSHEAILDKNPPYFLGDSVGISVKITNLLDQPQNGRFYYIINLPGGMLLPRPLHIKPDQPLHFDAKESKIIQLGDPIFCAFLGIFQLLIVTGVSEHSLVNEGGTNFSVFTHLAIFAGLSQDREAYYIQINMVTLTKWICGFTVALVVLTIALIALTLCKF